MTIVRAETQQKQLVDVDIDSIVQHFGVYGVLLKDNTNMSSYLAVESLKNEGS
jgi:hypothetical protein